MSTLRRVLRRLWHSAAGRRDDVRFQEELEDHLARQVDENVRAGLPPQEARRQAVLKFGPVEPFVTAIETSCVCPSLTRSFRMYATPSLASVRDTTPQ